MSDLELVTSSIDVPKNTGHEGFLHTLRQILKLPRVQSVEINARGKVTYQRFVAEDEPKMVGVDFTGVEPWHIIRNAADGVEELVLGTYNAAVVLAGVLDRASTEKLYPTAFVMSPNTVFWLWYPHTTSFSLASRDTICGLPIHFDRHIPDTTLILCASFARDGALVDTQKAYKVEMDYMVAPKTEVEVLDVSSSSQGSG